MRKSVDQRFSQSDGVNVYTGNELLVKGALEAEAKVGLKMNVPKKQLDAIVAQLSSLHTPTISSQTDSDWVALEVVIDEKTVRDLIPRLRKAGAEGIIEYPLNKVIY